MKVGDLVRVHLLNDLDSYPAIGVFLGYQGRKDRYTSHSLVFVAGKKIRVETMDGKAVK